MECVKAREDVDSGKYCEHIYPDILFWLADGYGVGWELDSTYAERQMITRWRLVGITRMLADC